MGANDAEARRWLSVIALLYAVAAWRLPGYLHPDEHFQTLEFANYALGRIAAGDLPWELSARIRPWLQPALYAALGQVVSPEHSTTFALAARLLTAALAWVGVAALGARYRDWFEDAATRRLAWVATATFYLLPMLRVRTSSENLAAALFMCGLALATRREARPRLDLAAGLLVGLAFDARYQLGFMIVGLLGWRALAGRAPRRAAYLALGLLAGVGVGLLVDRWGYGTWQLTPWRYAHENLVAGKAASFGEHPWWAYAGFLWRDLALPFNLIALLALPVAAWRAPRHPLVWVNLPFVIGHAAVGHKELRFLFPYLFFVPPLAVIAFGPTLARLGARPRRALLVGLFALNLWWLTVDRHPTLRAGAWMAPLIATELPLRHGGEDPFGRDGLHTWLYAPDRRSTAMNANDAAETRMPLVYYHFQRRARDVPEMLERSCERQLVSPWPWSVLPSEWLTHPVGRRVFATDVRHAVYRCPR